MQWFSTLIDILRRSKHIHVRRVGIDSPKDAIELVDRFVDDKLEYPLEWDDFISWKSSNESVERLRNQLADLERSLMSKDKEVRHQAVSRMLQLRNRYANLVGMPSRDDP
jgi:hypothetical protein